jgi:hypothetical protein
MKACANPECETHFAPKTHNQKYCSSECCRIVTNAKLMKKYYEKRDRLQGKKRKCERCDNLLSRYNEDTVCTTCQRKELQDVKKRVMEQIDAALV